MSKASNFQLLYLNQAREEHLPFASKWGFERGCQEGRERLSDLHRSPLISTDEMVNHYTEEK